MIENENNSNDEISKFYVAMTRAKSNLIISYSDKLTEFIDIPDRDLYFNQTLWNQKYISSNIKIEYSNKLPNTNPVWEYTGRDFLFTPYAIGLSKDGQDKLVKVVNGKRVDIRIGQRTIPTNFKDIKSLYSYMTNSRNYINVNKLFGVNLEEIKKCIEGLNI